MGTGRGRERAGHGVGCRVAPGGGGWERRGSVPGVVMSARCWVFPLLSATGGMETGSMEVGELRGHKANTRGGP